ncbi:MULTISPECIES: manganese efflux pump MntP family protein [Anaerotruncus]|uniref:Putative manganese efflux pump MntP n=2 Tax=Anaerotruncus TaxID=244127 RepID=A0A498CQJ7_9FIRM|nr:MULTISPECIES: manganese efflux pump MntP family protein [Anaerotruncus]MBC3937692.1 manganese efflux pump [Anaerotruncus massiliensis (ex Togo et al. 2019)]RLL14797.1 manganese efflux pump [Anaerotruncus massiliensis (ex Liu et al. 2021)]GKH46680.1 putative manganese efflux pump MntP 2 [Oscillospiraceae bacterium]
MGTPTLFLIALGLSMDAFAVSISNGMCYRGFGRKQAAAAAFSFGLFQMLMPIIGYLAGRTFSDAISAADHWIALLLLGFIGGKMVFDGVRELRHPEGCSPDHLFTFKVLAVQAVATSIDALAVGVGFAVMQVNIVTAAAFIGVVTFLCCIVGSMLGRQFGLLLGSRAQVLGGVILVGIGLKIFVEHMFG